MALLMHAQAGDVDLEKAGWVSNDDPEIGVRSLVRVTSPLTASPGLERVVPSETCQAYWSALSTPTETVFDAITNANLLFSETTINAFEARLNHQAGGIGLFDISELGFKKRKKRLYTAAIGRTAALAQDAKLNALLHCCSLAPANCGGADRVVTTEGDVLLTELRESEYGIDLSAFLGTPGASVSVENHSSTTRRERVVRTQPLDAVRALQAKDLVPRIVHTQVPVDGAGTQRFDDLLQVRVERPLAHGKVTVTTCDPNHVLLTSGNDKAATLVFDATSGDTLISVGLEVTGVTESDECTVLVELTDSCAGAGIAKPSVFVFTAEPSLMVRLPQDVTFEPGAVSATTKVLVKGVSKANDLILQPLHTWVGKQLTATRGACTSAKPSAWDLECDVTIHWDTGDQAARRQALMFFTTPALKGLTARADLQVYRDTVTAAP